MLLEFERLLVKRMARLGVPIFASEVLRSAERQADLYALGNSRARAGEGPHQYGCAVDLVHSVHGWSMDKTEWAIFGHVGKELAMQYGFKVTWGGDFSSLYDPAHWEITDWREVKRLIDADPSMWPTAEAVYLWKEADKAARKRLA